MTDTLNKSHTHYYGFDFYIEEHAEAPAQETVKHTSESSARQWTKEVNLEKQTITLPDGSSEKFEINAYKKTCMINGYDDIDYLLSLRKEIEEFEAHKTLA